VLFRNHGKPVLNLKNPPGIPMNLQRKGLDTLMELNQSRYEHLRDPEIASRISAYELAFRMQSFAPELIDLKGEDAMTLEMYGVNRKDPPAGATSPRARGAFCQPHASELGSSQQSQRRTQLQRGHGRPADWGVAHRLEAARHAV
jgi:hypothetical protein